MTNDEILKPKDQNERAETKTQYPRRLKTKDPRPKTNTMKILDLIFIQSLLFNLDDKNFFQLSKCDIFCVTVVVGNFVVHCPCLLSSTFMCNKYINKTISLIIKSKHSNTSLIIKSKHRNTYLTTPRNGLRFLVTLSEKYFTTVLPTYCCGTAKVGTTHSSSEPKKSSSSSGGGGGERNVLNLKGLW
jgi:hypothetical protein